MEREQAGAGSVEILDKSVEKRNSPSEFSTREDPGPDFQVVEGAAGAALPGVAVSTKGVAPPMTSRLEVKQFELLSQIAIAPDHPASWFVHSHSYRSKPRCSCRGAQLVGVGLSS